MDKFIFENIGSREIDDPAREIFTRIETERRKASADKLLAVLLSGAEVSRQNCHVHGIADFNSSIRSLVSDLVHRRNIPVARRYGEDGMAWYSITDQDKADYLDPEQREIQSARVRHESTSARIHSSLARALRTIRGALEYPALFERYPFAIEGSRRIHLESGHAIKKEGHAAKARAATNDMFENLKKSEVSRHG